MKARSTHRPLTAQAADNGLVRWLTVVGARQNNLRNLTVDIPLGRFVCVTGVSGSGKSSLVNDILRESLARELNGAERVEPGLHDRIEGQEHLDKVVDIDQSPIGRTPRSNPATYTKLFNEIRNLFSKLPESKLRGYLPGRFSFNVATGHAGGGRCEVCEGNGSNRMEMEILADVWVTCPVCDGRRFSRETLQVLFKGKCIADVLEMDVQQAIDHFENVPTIHAMLRTLHDVGLDYLKLGQSSTTLSGGEAQRVKLARELVKRSTGRTLYLLDEPTTGLHFADIKRLLAVLHGFVDAGNTVVVIEHNLDVIKTADWVIDLGPEGGAGGGRLVAVGTPEQVARSKRSYTGAALRDVLSPKRSAVAAPQRAQAAGATSRRSARQGHITVVGAKQHNLKDITVKVPRGKMTVCSGPSGSGKSSFAIDTVYAEGQRRYVESLSAYARQFLSRLQPPRVDHVHGLSPSICIEQRSTSASPRSTVGTVTEIYDFLRILWGRIGKPFCPACKTPIGSQTTEQVVARLLSLGEDRRVLLLAPISPGGQETYEQLFQRERRNGFARVRVDGIIYSLGESIRVDHGRPHTVELVVDRLTIRKAQTPRLTESVEQALTIGQGVVIVQPVDDDSRPAASRIPDENAIGAAATHRELRFSRHRSCERCARSFEELTPHHFSFNSRLGWCPTCEGLGTQQGAGPAAVVVHPTRSIADGAIFGWNELRSGSKLHAVASALADHIGFDLNRPWNELTEAQRLMFLYGCGQDWISVNPRGMAAAVGDLARLRFKWNGFFPAINRATRSNAQYRKRFESLVTEVGCEACSGSRLRPDAAAVRVEGATLHEICCRPMGQSLQWFTDIKLSPYDRKIAGDLLHEVTARLTFLVDVGLDYISLHRTASTLSGGESQRIQLASQIGSGLTGVIYVLDEPTIGLHPRDNRRLIGALHRLRDLDNTLLVVEHDREVIESADHVLDFGPGAGTAGGTITAAADPASLCTKRASLTGRYLSQREAIPVPENRRPVQAAPMVSLRNELTLFDDDAIAPQFAVRERATTDRSGQRWLIVHGAREHNLKEIDVAFPLGRFTCVTGVSGSGKSTLVSSVLYHALAARIHRARLVPGGHDSISGVKHIDKVINVDQSAIGNSPTSNPATYTGVFDAIRELLAALPLSKVRGYTANRFSFNRPGGRCEACLGMGQRCIEMHFLPDVWVECENCKGSRYVAETLDVRFRDANIAEILAMPVTAALQLFENVPAVKRMLQTLDDVGLGYVQLGQAAPTLSGGEAQRVKLAAELGRPSTGETLYILDEPTTGLHFSDIKRLLDVLHRLVDLGNTCLCIEHNLDVIKTADWVIDLGPEAGDDGGYVVVAGTPESVAATPTSHTGTALKPVLEAGPRRRRTVYDPDRSSDPAALAAMPTDLGEAMQMPWERDGRAWHTVNHVDSSGVPVLWDAKLLIWLVETIESLGPFAPTDWNARSRIEITAASGRDWFCHLLTRDRDLLEAVFRVPRGTFPSSALAAMLPIAPLDERTDLPIYGQWDRVRVRPVHDQWEEVRLSLRDFKDASKQTLRRFLKKAAESYFEQVKAEAADPAAREPWTSDGRRWHLSQKSIHRRHAILWKADLLPALIGRFKAIQPDLYLDWNSRTAVKLLTPGRRLSVGKIVTNMGKGLRVELRAPKGSVTPAMIDGLGEDTEIKHLGDFDWIIFWVRSLAAIDARQLRDLWPRCQSVHGADRLQLA